MKIKITGWNYGLKKISFTKLQMQFADLSLKYAKGNTDRVLDNEEIVFDFDDEETGLKFYEEATVLGLNCEIMDSELK
jgi:hypothetical protein